MAERVVVLRVVHPSAKSELSADLASLVGLHRLKRIRSGVAVSFTTSYSGFQSATPARNTLQGMPVVDGQQLPVLEQFCSKPTPQFVVREGKDSSRFELEGDKVGVSSMADIFLADTYRDMVNLGSNDRPKQLSLSCRVNTPVRELIFDALIHEDIFSGIDPEPMMFDLGTATNTSNLFEEDAPDVRLEPIGQIQSLNKQIDQLRIEEIDRYLEMIDYVCSELGWDRSRFKAYRWQVDFPLTATEYKMVFS